MFPMQMAFLSFLPPVPSPESTFQCVSLLKILLCPYKWEVEGDWKRTMENCYTMTKNKTTENETIFNCWISQNHPYSFCCYVFWVAETCCLEITLPRLVWLQLVERRPFPSCTFQPGKLSWMCEGLGPLLSWLFFGRANGIMLKKTDFWVLLDL